MHVGEDIYQMEGSCFGLSTLPEIWMKSMGVFQKKWRSVGVMVWIYLDDILLVAKSPKLLNRHLQMALGDLHDAAMELNWETYVITTSQSVKHLGFFVNFQEGRLEVPKKLKK